MVRVWVLAVIVLVVASAVALACYWVDYYRTPEIVREACEWCREHGGPVCCSRLSCASCLHEYAGEHGLNMSFQECYDLCPPSAPETENTLPMLAWILIFSLTTGITLLILGLTLDVKKNGR